METNPEFTQYMDRYFEYKGLWDSPSKCGIRIIERGDSKTLVIATEIYRQNPGTPVTEYCATLATQILEAMNILPENFIFIEHTPDLRSKLAFYNETFHLVSLEWDGSKFINPKWETIERHDVDAMMAV
jgi:hypothetical protein